MGKYKVIIQPAAEKDFSKHKKFGNKTTITRIITILSEYKFILMTELENPKR